MAIKGFDLLGLPKQNIKMLKKNLPKGCAIGVLCGTFGEVTRPLSTLLDTGKIVAVRAHIINTVCKRNHNCEHGEPGPYDLDTFRKRVAKFEILAHKYPKVKFYLSPALEYDEKDEALIKRWVRIIKHGCPSAQVVLNPHSGVLVGDYLREKHGNKNTPSDIRSNDGEDFFDLSNPDNYKNQGSVITFGWTHSFNCREKGASWVPPSKRTIQCTSKEIANMWKKLK